MPYTIDVVDTAKKQKEFLHLPYRLYQNNPNWVAPLYFLIKQTIKGKNNPLFQRGPHILYLLRDPSKKTIGRILVGIDEKTNQEKQSNRGYLSLFECINDEKAAFMLFDQAFKWLKERNISFVEGPISPTSGDDYRGLLVKGFDSPPTLLNSYNPPYYETFFQNYGFEKYKDLITFDFTVENFPFQRLDKLTRYAMKKYDFRVDAVDFKNMHREITDVHTILQKSVPESWDNFVVPTIEEIEKETKFLKKFIDPDFVCIARKNQTNQPLGFVVSAPDYNQVIQKMKGKIFPLGWLIFLRHRKKIHRLRLFIQFVVPEYQGRGVITAIFHHFFKIAPQKNITSGEGGTVGEDNEQAKKILLACGGKINKRYRIYRKQIQC